jgi:carboxypeptidase T
VHVRLRAPSGTRRLTVIALAALAAVVPAAPSAPEVSGAEPDFPSYDARYHNPAEMVSDIEAVEAAHRDLVHVFSIGLSQGGRPIWAAKVSENVGVDEPEPEVLVDALHHAREHLSVEQALYLFHVLADDYATDARVRALVDTREVWFIFALNPDGFVYDLGGHPYRAWRKNRQPSPGSSAVGTDLNRNYDYLWGCCRGSSARPGASTYRGPKPFSAPETRAIRDFVQSRIVGGRQQIRTHVTLHTNGQRILFPYGYTVASRPPDMSQDDRDAFRALARAMANRNGYTPMQSSHLYLTDGDEIDWMYGRQRIFSFTFELYPVPQRTVWADSYPGDEHIAAETARNREALLYLIEQAGCPYEVLGAAKARLNCGPFFDDLEIPRGGWGVNPDGTDTATRGAWQRGDPEETTSNGAKQLGTATSGRSAFVTGLRAGASAASNDVDGGETTLRSPRIALPADPATFGSLSFSYTFAHGAATEAGDGLAAYVERADGGRTLVFEARGRPVDVDGAWAIARVSLAPWAGQSVRIVFVARDVGRDSLVETAIDDLRVERPA